MNEKRFEVTDNTDNPFLCDWSVTDYGDSGIVHHPMTSENMVNVICDLSTIEDSGKNIPTFDKKGASGQTKLV